MIIVHIFLMPIPYAQVDALQLHAIGTQVGFQQLVIRKIRAEHTRLLLMLSLVTERIIIMRGNSLYRERERG